MVYWALLYTAMLLEVAGTTSMKLSRGFTAWTPTLWGLFFYALSLGCLTIALKKLELGPAYAIWAGLGTLFVAVIGVVYFDDQLNALKLVSLLLVVVGVVGLNCSDIGH